MRNIKTFSEYSFTELIELEKWLEEQKESAYSVTHYGQFDLKDHKQVVTDKITSKINLIRTEIWDKLDKTVTASYGDVKDF